METARFALTPTDQEKLFDDPELLKCFTTHHSLRTSEQKHQVINTLLCMPKLLEFAKDKTDIKEFTRLFAELFEYELIPAGSAVFHFAEQGDEFYIILKGQAGVFIPKTELEMMDDAKDASKLQISNQLNEFFSKHPETPKSLLLRGDTGSFPSEINVDGLTSDEKMLYCASDHKLNYFRKGVCSFKRINSLAAGDSFGEIALIFNRPRAASVIAISDMHVVKVNVESYKIMFDDQIKSVESKVAFLSTIFKSVNKQILARVCYCIEEKPFGNNQFIYKQGAPAQALYIVREGEVKIYREVNLKPKGESAISKLQRSPRKTIRQNVASLGPGSIFGEETVMNKEFHDCNAVSSSIETFVYQISRESYHSVIALVYGDVAQLIRQRLNLNTKWRAQRVKKLADSQFQISLLNEKAKEMEVPKKLEELSPEDQELIKTGPRYEAASIIKLTDKRIAHFDFKDQTEKRRLLKSFVDTQKRTSRVLNKPVEIDTMEGNTEDIDRKKQLNLFPVFVYEKEIARKLLRNYRYVASNYPLAVDDSAFTPAFEEHSMIQQTPKASAIRAENSFMVSDSRRTPSENRQSSPRSRLGQKSKENTPITKGDMVKSWSEVTLPPKHQRALTAKTAVSSNKAGRPCEEAYSHFRIELETPRIVDSTGPSPFNIKIPVRPTSRDSRHTANPQRLRTHRQHSYKSFGYYTQRLEENSTSQCSIVNFTECSISSVDKKTSGKGGPTPSLTRNLIHSQHNMFRMKPKRLFLMEKYLPITPSTGTMLNSRSQTTLIKRS